VRVEPREVKEGRIILAIDSNNKKIVGDVGILLPRMPSCLSDTDELEFWMCRARSGARQSASVCLWRGVWPQRSEITVPIQSKDTGVEFLRMKDGSNMYWFELCITGHGIRKSWATDHVIVHAHNGRRRRHPEQSLQFSPCSPCAC